MTSYPIHTVDSAPEASRPALEALQKVFGFIPAVAGVMASSATLLKGFAGAFGNFHSGTFTEGQIQVLLLTNAVTNDSAWAVALHTSLALEQGVARADVEAMREGRAPGDPQLAALSALTRALIETRGHVGDAEVAPFVAAGFRPDQVLEVIAGIAASAMTNYTASLARLE